MRNGLIGGILGVVIAAVIGFMIWGRPLDDEKQQRAAAEARAQSMQSAVTALTMRKPRYAHIKLEQVGTSADCTATIDNTKMGGYQDEDVEWYILHDELKPCTENGAWAVWLEFTEADFPLPERKFRIGKTHRKLKIKTLANLRNYTYKVRMREHSGNEYTLIDPDLEVEPPPPPGPIVPAAPPVKKG